VANEQGAAPLASERDEDELVQNGPKRKRLTRKTHPSELAGNVKEERRSRSSGDGPPSAATDIKLEDANESGAPMTLEAAIHGGSQIAGANIKSEVDPAEVSKGKSRVKKVASAKPAAPVQSPKNEAEAASPGSAASASASASPAARRTGQEYCFTATGLELEPKYRRQLKSRLDVAFVDEWSPDVTHLLADTFRRTTKMMCAICAGVRIVTPDYINACLQAGFLVDDAPFALNDTVCEAAFAKKHGLPRYSLQAALEESRRSGPLLTGVAVHCSPVVVGRSDMKTLVQAAGARWLRHIPESPQEPDAEPVLVLGKAGVEPPPRYAERWRMHVAYDAELLREAACTQKLRYDVYKL
jgi:hypothetical protein